MTTTFPIKMLMCPHCEGRFELFLYSFQPHYGILKCTCREYPVVYSIPMLIDFPESKQVIELIRDHDPKQALLLALNLFATNPDFQQHDPAAKEGRGRMLQIIDDPLITFEQTLQALCSPDEAAAMFFRTAHRSLAAGLALMALSTDVLGPILHVGCGSGHLERALSNRIPSGMIIGLDERFPLLYAARKYMAPDGNFVFASLSRKLPIRKETFDIVLTDEVVGRSPRRVEMAEEVLRVVRTNEGALMASTTLAEIDSFTRRLPDHRLRRLSTKRLVERFVKEHAVDATSGDSDRGVASVVATRRPSLFARRLMEDLMVCRSPRVNPVYVTSEIGEMVKLERRQDLPEGILDPNLLEAGALPEKIEFSKQIIRDLQDGQVTPEAMDLLFRLVLVDLPLDYS